ncbi:MAG: ribose 5-phosphate isomerase B [Bacteroidetes bacterium CG2_30_33_31]|nr:MAG: ribose 5-phosphate isomerase B [Bacteroidetes bacterium CG2_30_33_31]
MFDKKNTIVIGCDHAAYELKEFIKSELIKLGYQIKDFGTHSKDSVDYPDFIHPLAQAIQNKEFEIGIIACGSGNGVAITANKHSKVRAAMAWNTELAKLARQHNDANVIALSARYIAKEYALEIVLAFLNAEFEGGRHQKRVDKISAWPY